MYPFFFLFSFLFTDEKRTAIQYSKNMIPPMISNKATYMIYMYRCSTYILPVKRKKLSFNDSYMYICIYVYVYIYVCIYIPCFFGLLVTEAIYVCTRTCLRIYAARRQVLCACYRNTMRYG